MTSGNFVAMNEAEQRDLARRLWEGSEVFDFDTALELVRCRPNEARELLQMDVEMERRQKERDRARDRLRQALIEDFG
jgi:hypothetical protein